MAPPACLLLCLCLFLGGGRARTTEAPKTPGKCHLEGTWVNELGSRMSISALDGEGRFSGSYLTGVTASQNPIRTSGLTGAQRQGAQPTFGFTVLWSFSDSMTVFVGQCFVSESGEETLETSWLLRETVPSHSEDWKATRVGTNTFLRLK
nr:PREDICTED: avidin-like [Anolis carolinensis]|eukprot:XP_008120950.1 PREDICTED: avidin-like [Anolis carolinensis]